MPLILSDLLSDVNTYASLNECALRNEITRLRRASRHIPRDVIDARIQLCQQRIDEIGLISECRVSRADPLRYAEASRLLRERQRCIDSTIASIEVMEMA